MERKSQVIGRVAVDRAIRFVRAPAPAPGAVPSAAGRACAHCGQPLCDPARAHLFAGMTLRCPACGESTRG